MAKKVKAQLDPVIARCKIAQRALVQESFFRMIDVAQFPRAKGGRMPIDTGFLRASGQARLNGMPTGPVRPPAGFKARSKNNPLSTPRINDRAETSIITAISKFNIGNSLFFGWSAIYANRMNIKYGFLDNAVAQWPAIVKRVTAEIRLKAL